MQTFLPYKNYIRSAQALDKLRLNKQAVECYQIVLTIFRKKGWLPNPTGKKGWWNHPAVKMWESDSHSLLCYWNAIITECRARNIKADIHRKNWMYCVKIFEEECDTGNLSAWCYAEPLVYPDWITPELTQSHQSNLLKKDQNFYKFEVPNNLPYVWPK